MSDVAWRAPLRDILSSTAASVPGAQALVLPEGTSVTFAELDVASARLAEALPTGARIGVRLGNDQASVAAIHAVWRRGGSVVSVGRLVPDGEVERRLAEAGAGVLLEPGPGLTAEVRSTGTAVVTPGAGEALVIFTSGTTGRPKAASLSDSAIEASVRGIAAGSGLPPEGRPPQVPSRPPQPVFVPVAHMGGFLTSLSSWWLGKPLLLCPRFSVELVADLAQRMRIGVLRVTPAMVYELAHADSAVTLPGVTSAAVGTAALPEATRLAFEERFGVPVLRNYGQTEFAGAIAFERPDDVAAGRRPPGSVGRTAPGVEVRIVDGAGRSVPAGEVGEIWARSASSMSGYLDDGGAPVSDAEAAGWLPTGDLGTLDADGFLSVVGRVRDLILCGGFNIYPAHVEAALNRLPDVADSAVAGLPDERLGEVPVAAVVSRPGVTLDPERIRTELRAELAAYELPRKLIQVSAVPRFDTGKVDRDAVRRAVEQALTAGSSR